MKISWQQKITDVEATGLSLTEIAQAVGLAKSSLSEIKSGTTKAPSGDAAVALYLLHRRRCKVRPPTAPPEAMASAAPAADSEAA